MEKQRLEAFSDGVIAIIITIMVLELKPPHEASFAALAQLAPVFFSYVLSFAYIAIYWNNHHHLLQAASHVTGRVLWANIHLLFWLSLIPFASAWMAENHFAGATVAVYGAALLAPAIAYFILSRMLLKTHGPEFDARARHRRRRQRQDFGAALSSRHRAYIHRSATIARDLRARGADVVCARSEN